MNPWKILPGFMSVGDHNSCRIRSASVFVSVSVSMIMFMFISGVFASVYVSVFLSLSVSVPISVRHGKYLVDNPMARSSWCGNLKSLSHESKRVKSAENSASLP
jgi:hypothetical protein